MDELSDIEIPFSLKNIPNDVDIHIFEFKGKKCLRRYVLDESIFNNNRMYMIIDVKRSLLSKKITKTIFVVSNSTIDIDLFRNSQLIAEKLVELDKQKTDTISNLIVVSPTWRPDRFNEILNKKTIKPIKAEWSNKFKDLKFKKKKKVRSKSENLKTSNENGDDLSSNQSIDKKVAKPSYNQKRKHKAAKKKNNSPIINDTNFFSEFEYIYCEPKVITLPSSEVKKDQASVYPIKGTTWKSEEYELKTTDKEMAIEINDKKNEVLTNPNEQIILNTNNESETMSKNKQKKKKNDNRKPKEKNELNKAFKKIQNKVARTNCISKDLNNETEKLSESRDTDGTRKNYNKEQSKSSSTMHELYYGEQKFKNDALKLYANREQKIAKDNIIENKATDMHKESNKYQIDTKYLGKEHAHPKIKKLMSENNVQIKKMPDSANEVSNNKNRVKLLSKNRSEDSIQEMDQYCD